MYPVDKTVKFGGVGNAAYGLCNWFDKVVLALPKKQIQDYYTSHLKPIYLNLHIEEIDIPWHPFYKRIWQNGLIDKIDHADPDCCCGDCTQQSSILRQMVAYKITGLTKKYNINTYYIEWHSIGDGSFAYQATSNLPKVDLSNIDIFLDVRHPYALNRHIFNWSPKRLFWKMNDKEFKSIDQDYLFSLFNKCKTEEVYLLRTLADKGSMLFKYSYYQKKLQLVHSVNGLKTINRIHSVGSGDAYFSTFCGCISSGMDIKSSMEYANVAGGLATTKPYVYVPSKEEIINYKESGNVI